RVESPRATGLSSVAFASGFMETHLLTGERNISQLLHKRQAGGILHSSHINDSRTKPFTGLP
ncbi:hypothetical protein, partial [Hafnia paralvei]|uniref:hypothetical protein n=1 Tax=Hafnia paralvei TaxID=546367 RepID=UPI0028D06A62